MKLGSISTVLCSAWIVIQAESCRTLARREQLKPCHLTFWLVVTTLVVLLSACATSTATPAVETAVTALPPVEASTPFSPASPAPSSGGESAETTATTLISPAEASTPSPTAFSASIVPPGRIRPSAIAGTWYPADPDELATMMDALLAVVRPVDGNPISLVVPHAGYVYSGLVAARGFKQLAETEYEVAVIIAADHQPPLSDPISVWTEGGFETPLGVVPVDVELAEVLVAADPRITFDPATHEEEHPIEIELPFLQRICPHCRIVPVLMGTDDEETVQALADALLSVLPDRRAVVIASSDLSHYPRQEDALRVDGATLAAVETGDPAAVRAAIATSMAADVPNLATCACGEGPILVAMRVATGLGADTTTVLGYASSADSPYGNSEQVVGYGAVMLWRYASLDLTEERQEELLRLARDTIATYVGTGEIPEYETDDPVLNRRSGVFVTLRNRDEPFDTTQGDSSQSNLPTFQPPETTLRGCIGRLRADMPLYRVVQEMAVAAAISDPRFPPLTAEELEQTSIEISVLSPLRRITDTQQVEVGRHGLVILQAGQQGVLLPQVPVENGWDREEYLENLCLKAGLPDDCWTDRPTLYAFTAMVFGE